MLMNQYADTIYKSLTSPDPAHDPLEVIARTFETILQRLDLQSNAGRSEMHLMKAKVQIDSSEDAKLYTELDEKIGQLAPGILRDVLCALAKRTQLIVERLNELPPTLKWPC